MFLGTHVVSGTARVVAVQTGKETEFGKISDHLKLRPVEPQFERGIRRFGLFLLEVTLALVAIIFAVNVFFHRPVLEAFLFSLALPVGLTPQLLPAIISINLAHGAKGMAKNKAIVKRLASIENFGSMNVLCSDKTRTLTEGTVRLQSALDPSGKPSEKVFLHAYLNAAFESGFANPLDGAIRAYAKPDISAYRKLDEVPYDFIRKRLSILVDTGGRTLMITKGALNGVLDICSRADRPGGQTAEISKDKQKIQQEFEALSRQGYRLIGVACREMGAPTTIGKHDEREMTFLGYLVFFDPPKAGISETIAGLRRLGVTLKMITGDKRQLRQHVQHGRRLSVPRLPAAFAQADPPHQPDDRFPGDDDRHGPRRSGDGGEAAVLGYRLHPLVHDDLRPGELPIRLYDVWHSPLDTPGDARSVSYRLVHGIGHLRLRHRSGDPEPQAFLQKPARHGLGDRHRRHRADYADPPLHGSGATVRPCSLAASFLVLMGLIVVLYVGAAELAKTFFYRKAGN